MDFLKSCLILFLVLSERLSESSTQNVLYYRQRSKYLSGRKIGKKNANSEAECAMYCLRNERCVSVNYKTTGKDFGLCELNNGTLAEGYSNSGDREGFNYLQIIKRVKYAFNVL